MRIRWSRLAWPLTAIMVLILGLSQLVFLERGLHPFGGPTVVGKAWTLANYTRILTDPFFTGAFWKTAYISLLATAVTLVLAYPLAYLIARSRSRWAFALLVLVFSSSFVSIVIRMLGLKVILGPEGLINQFLRAVGLVKTSLPLVNNVTGVVIGLVQIEVPVLTLLLVPVIMTIERSLEEAAAGLGASRAQTLRRVVIPLSLPGVLGSALIVFSVAIGAFVTPAVLGGNLVAYVPLLIQEQVLSVLNYPQGSALALILNVIALFFVVLGVWVAARSPAARGQVR